MISFLILPMQRVTRLPLLLDVSLTFTFSTAHVPTKMTQCLFTGACCRCNPAIQGFSGRRILYHLKIYISKEINKNHFKTPLKCLGTPLWVHGQQAESHFIYFSSSVYTDVNNWCFHTFLLASQTICQKTPDKTAEYFAAVWALHAISKVELIRTAQLNA